MLSDRFSLEAVNFPFVYFENHSFLVFSSMLWATVKASIIVIIVIIIIIIIIAIIIIKKFC